MMLATVHSCRKNRPAAARTLSVAVGGGSSVATKAAQRSGALSLNLSLGPSFGRSFSSSWGAVGPSGGTPGRSFAAAAAACSVGRAHGLPAGGSSVLTAVTSTGRSEEHTSELQSLAYLVC